MIRSIFIGTAIAAVFATSAFAGHATSNSASIVQVGGKYNSANIGQVGTTNTALTVQAGRSNARNSANTFQLGKNNAATIGQAGKYNSGNIYQGGLP